MYILLAPRWFLVGLLTAIAGVLVRLSCAWSTFALGTLLGVGLPVLHATFRCVCVEGGGRGGEGGACAVFVFVYLALPLWCL